MFCALETARNFFVAGLSRQLQKIQICRILLDKILVMPRYDVHLRSGLREILRMKTSVGKTT
jgi:hypothetical protein